MPSTHGSINYRMHPFAAFDWHAPAEQRGVLLAQAPQEDRRHNRDGPDTFRPSQTPSKITRT